MTNKLKSTYELTVSQDGMTLTRTIYETGQKKPLIQVCEKQM